MSQEPRKFKRTNEQRSRNHFIGFVVATFGVAIANAFVDVYPIANWFTIFFVVIAVIQIYLSYKLTL